MLKRFTKANINGETNQGGVYNFYNKKKERIYTGRASGNIGGKWGDSPDGGNFRYGLKHRLQSYKQKDDPKEHPTKVALRPKIAYYEIRRKDVPPKSGGNKGTSLIIEKMMGTITDPLCQNTS